MMTGLDTPATGSVKIAKNSGSLCSWILGTGILAKSYQNGVSHTTGRFARGVLPFVSVAQS